MANKTLVARILRLAESSPPGAKVPDHDQIVAKLEPLVNEGDNYAKLASYLEELNELSGVRTNHWLRTLQAEYKDAWTTLTEAAGGLSKIGEDEEAPEEVEPTEPAEEEAGCKGCEGEKKGKGKKAAEEEVPEPVAAEDLDEGPIEVVEEAGDEEAEEEVEAEEEIEEEAPVAGKTPMAGVKASSIIAGKQKKAAKAEGKGKKAADEDEEVVEQEEAEEAMAAEPVVGPAQLEKEGEVSLALFNADTKPHYAVFFNGKPLAEIRLADQERPNEIRDAFVSEEYAKHVAETCQTMGAKETLVALKARFYQAAVETGALAERAAATAETKLEGQYAERLAALKDDFLNTVNLAITASNKGTKGLFIENGLKVALRDAIRRAGVGGASAIIDEVWAKHASPYFDSVFTKAEEWMGYSPEALHEVTKEILGTSGLEEDETVEEARQAQAVEATKGPMNVPIISASVQEHDQTDLRAHYASIMNFKGRLAQKLGARHR